MPLSLRLMLFVVLAGCAGKNGADGANGAISLLKVTAEPAGANCAQGGRRIDTGLDDGKDGSVAADQVLQAGEVRSTSYVCDGAEGFTALTKITAESTGANCATGGQRIDFGLDNGDSAGTARNGTLEAGEIDATAYVCNGANGVKGTSSLVTLTDEAPGLNCAAGGKRLDIGLDNGDGAGTAGDGLLQAGEIDSTSYVCNGAGGVATLFTLTNEPQGANCAAGGKRIDSGLDNGDGAGTARDGVLQSGEIDNTSYVCNGCTPVHATLSAVASISANYAAPGSIYNDDLVRAYNNPGCGPACDIVGWYGFDLSSVPSASLITSMTLNARLVSDFGSPSGSPTVVVQYSSEKNWTRAGTSTGFARGAVLSPSPVAPTAGQVNTFIAFPIDLSLHDFTTDLSNKWVTLGLDDTNLVYSYGYFSGSDTSNAATLSLDYSCN